MLSRSVRAAPSTAGDRRELHSSYLAQALGRHSCPVIALSMPMTHSLDSCGSNAPRTTNKPFDDVTSGAHNTANASVLVPLLASYASH